MRLISFVYNGQECWGAVVNDQFIELAQPSGCARLAEFVGSPAFAQRDDIVKQQQPLAAFTDVTLLPVIPKPAKIVCVLRNYMDPGKGGSQGGAAAELPAYPP